MIRRRSSSLIALKRRMIAEQDGYLRVAPRQQIGVGCELPRQLRREELLEANLHFGRRPLLLDAGPAGRHAPGQRLDQHRFQRADQVARARAFRSPIAVQRADDFALAIQQRRGNRGHQADAAGSFRGQVRRRRPASFFSFTTRRNRSLTGVHLRSIVLRVPFVQSDDGPVAVGANSRTRPLSRPISSTISWAARS